MIKLVLYLTERSKTKHTKLETFIFEVDLKMLKVFFLEKLSKSQTKPTTLVLRN